MSQLLDYTKKLTKIEKKKIKKLFLGQNCLKQIMILDYTKNQKNRKKIEKLFLAENFLKRIINKITQQKSRKRFEKHFWVKIVLNE